MTPAVTTDGRRLRGDATRRKVAREAAMIATVSGLDSISVGGLAASTGVSKSGILTVFGNREQIQVAAVAEARRIYREHVIGPAWASTPGRARLRALVEAWRRYVDAGIFTGGCFLATAAVEYGHRRGPVADAVRRLKREWLDLLEDELRMAGSAHAADDAFRIDAYLDAGTTQRQLYDDPGELDRARRLALGVIG